MDFNLIKEPVNEIKKACDAIISFFPEYQNIMYKVFTTSQNMSHSINNIKKTIFDEILIVYHEESMENILYIIKTIQDKYSPKYFLAIADFIDLVYQNAFYDIFATKFQELELIEPEKIKEAHLNIFNLIIYVEHVKYKLYEELESKSSDNLAILNTLKKRKSNSILRINVCVNIIENYPPISNQQFNYKNVIEKYNIYIKTQDYTDKFFKDIN
jgi:hypothetical protein